MIKLLVRKLFYLVVAFWLSLGHAGIYDDFFTAVNKDDAHTVIRLLNRGFDVNSPGPTGQPALAMALQLENFRVAEVLMRVAALNVDQPNMHGETALMLAALKGDLEWTRRLVLRGALVRRPGWTPLHYAASGPEPKVVGFLIDAGAEVDAVSPFGTTALMMAARYGDQRSVQVLLDRGAAVGLRHPAGHTVVDFARMAGRDALADRLQAMADTQGTARRVPAKETGK